MMIIIMMIMIMIMIIITTVEKQARRTSAPLALVCTINQH